MTNNEVLMHKNTLGFVGAAAVAILLTGCAAAEPVSHAAPTTKPSASAPAPTATPDAAPAITDAAAQGYMDSQATLVAAACEITTTGQVGPASLATFKDYTAYLNMFSTGQALASPASGAVDEGDADTIYGNLITLTSGLDNAVNNEAGADQTVPVPAEQAAQLGAICAAANAHAE